MQSVSAEFEAAAVATVRKTRARVTITWTDPYIDLNISASGNEENRVNYPNQVADLIETVPYKWFHLDGITTLANLTHPMPSTALLAKDYQVGWWGADRCDASADFSVAYPALTLEFSARPTVSLRVVGDDKYNEYPVDFVIQVYNGVTLVHTETVTGNALLIYEKDITAENITVSTKMVLTISKWSTAFRVVKITEFYNTFSEIYDGDDVSLLSILEEAELSEGSLPIGNISSNECDLELENINNRFFPGNTDSIYHVLMKRNRRIEPELGFVLPDTSIEYVPMGVFWSDEWSVPEMGTTAKTSGRDRMELLRKTIYSTSVVSENTTLYALAVAVMEDAKLIQQDLQYAVDTELQNYTIEYAWMPRKSHMASIRDIVEAAIGRAYCDRDGIVQIKGHSSLSGASIKSITKDHYFNRLQPAKTEEISNIIQVKTFPLAPATADQEVYKSQTPTAAIPAGNTISVDVEYSEPPIIDGAATAYIPNGAGGLDGTWPAYSNSQLTITAATVYYAWGATVYIKNETASPEQAIIVIAGKPLTVQGQEIILDSDSDSIDEYGELKYEFPDNHLVQDRATGELIGSSLLASYKTARRDVDLDWRGNPALELADTITAPEYQKGAINVQGEFAIIRQNFQYDGALRARLAGRKTGQATTTTTTAAP